MSFEATRQSIVQRMVDNWVATPVAYENLPFEPTADEPWVAFQVQTGQGITFGISGTEKTAQTTGLISLQIFVPAGKGTKIANELVDQFLPIYEHKRFNGILTYTATVGHSGVNNGWHQMNITIPYRRIRNV